MSRRPLPLRSIEVFTVAAKTLSFTLAADTLGLTLSAVSRRIQDLEVELGVRLFSRFNRRIELTAAGFSFHAGIASAFNTIEIEIDRLRTRSDLRYLKISTLQSFASAWLVPRLAAIKRQHADLSIMLETTTNLVNFDNSDVHAAIRFGNGDWGNLITHRLLELTAFPVCAPGLGHLSGRITPAVLDQFVILSITQAPQIWSEWFSTVGLPDYTPRAVQLFDNAEILYEAASAGMGLALGVDVLVQRYLDSGRLARASETSVSLSSTYHLVYRTRDRDIRALQLLRDALLEK